MSGGWHRMIHVTLPVIYGAPSYVRMSDVDDYIQTGEEGKWCGYKGLWTPPSLSRRLTTSSHFEFYISWCWERSIEMPASLSPSSSAAGAREEETHSQTEQPYYNQTRGLVGFDSQGRRGGVPTVGRGRYSLFPASLPTSLPAAGLTYASLYTNRRTRFQHSVETPSGLARL